MNERKVVVITGAPSGFGNPTARALARAGHTVYAGMRASTGPQRAACRRAGNTSTRGGHPPFLAPYFAAKAAMDALAESYAAELIKFGIDTVIVTPGAYPTGTIHFAHADAPADCARAADYDEVYGPTRRRIGDNLAGTFPDGHDATEVADEITRVISLPAGRRPFRTHVDPSRDGSEVVSTVADRIRAEFYHRIGITDLHRAQAHA